MDNAARALLIAGGILMAIIVISVLIMMRNNISQIGQAERDASNAKQIAKFNEPFMSYYKNAMYGTDVISVLSLAINNNLKYKVTDPNEEYFVDIEFAYKIDTTALDTTEYKLSELGPSGSEEAEYLIANADTKDETERAYSFKKSIFACTNIEYDDNGMIILMRFEEVAQP